MSEEKYREAAKDLSRKAVGLITQIIQKHDAAILEEVQDQIQSLQSRNARLTEALEAALPVILSCPDPTDAHFAVHEKAELALQE